MADVILLERRGVPSAAICTDALRVSADAMAVIQGAPGYRYAVVPHPVSSLEVDGLRAHARLAAPQILEILRAEGGPGAEGGQRAEVEPGVEGAEGTPGRGV